MSDKPDWWTSDHWATPPAVFDAIARVFGPFDLDACATEANAKCARYYDEAQNGLAQPWLGRVWVNPPYSDPSPWIGKALDATHGREASRVVMLLPAATDTAWYHDLVLPYAHVVTVRGRVKFLGWHGKPIGTPKSGSVIAVFPKLPATFSLRAHQAPLVEL
jgi:phage N-6-adenine-methyltransferase